MSAAQGRAGSGGAAAVDVAVVGVGPAGAAAAVTAAAAGLEVVAVDRARFPRDKCCGDGLTTGALRQLEALGLSPFGLPSWQPVRQVRIRVPDGRHGDFCLPDDHTTYAATLRRRDLDAALVRRARHAGAEVWEGHAVVDARAVPGGDGVELVLDDARVLRARHVVAADGMWSPMRKATGAGQAGYRGEWHALRQYLHGTGPGARQLRIWFEDDIRPGYVWSFPLPEGGVNAGFGIRRAPGRPRGSLAQHWEEIRQRPHIAAVLGPGAEPEGPVRTWPIPAGISRNPTSAWGGRVLFVGDAARAADPMTGEGIAQALETGRLAGGTIAALGRLGPGAVGAAYRMRIGAGLALDDRLSERLSGVLAGPRGVNAWLDVATSGERARRMFVRWMFEDFPRATPFTPWRWRPGLLNSPGAWAGS